MCRSCHLFHSKCSMWKTSSLKYSCKLSGWAPANHLVIFDPSETIRCYLIWCQRGHNFHNRIFLDFQNTFNSKKDFRIPIQTHQPHASLRLLRIIYHILTHLKCRNMFMCSRSASELRVSWHSTDSGFDQFDQALHTHMQYLSEKRMINFCHTQNRSLHTFGMYLRFLASYPCRK